MTLHLEPGLTFGGCRIEEVTTSGLGRTVARAAHGVDRAVLLHVLAPDAPDFEARRRDWGAEAARLVGLHHPGLLPVYDAGEHAGCLYAVASADTGDILAHRAALVPSEKRRLIDETIDAANAAAAAGVAVSGVGPDDVRVIDGRAVITPAIFGPAAVSSERDVEKALSGLLVADPGRRRRWPLLAAAGALAAAVAAVFAVLALRDDERRPSGLRRPQRPRPLRRLHPSPSGGSSPQSRWARRLRASPLPAVGCGWRSRVAHC